MDKERNTDVDFHRAVEKMESGAHSGSSTSSNFENMISL
jgi:hypothetical protein